MVENRVREGRRRVFKGKREREIEGKRETMTCKDLVIKNHPNSHDREGENSYEFAKKIKSLKLPPGTKMYSFDAEALYPSIPIADCIKEILRQLKEDETLKNRTNLTSDDIADLISLCLETTDFVYNNRHNTTNDSGPIGLSLMVYIAQIWMIYTIKQAVKLAKEKNIPTPQELEVYMDDCWCFFIARSFIRQGLRNNNSSTDPASDFNDCLNSIHERVKFTREEEIDGKIAFLDVLIKKYADGNLSTQVYRKPSNTNVILKPHSCHDPTTHIATFKGELCRAWRICSSPELYKKEVELILNIYEDNGHDRKKFEKIAKEYKPPEPKKQQQVTQVTHTLHSKTIIHLLMSSIHDVNKTVVISDLLRCHIDTTTAPISTTFTVVISTSTSR